MRICLGLLALVLTGCARSATYPAAGRAASCIGHTPRSEVLGVEFTLAAGFTYERTGDWERWMNRTRQDGHWRGFWARIEKKRPTLAPPERETGQPAVTVFGVQGNRIGCIDCLVITGYRREELRIGGLPARLETAIVDGGFDHHTADPMVLLTWRRADGRWAVVEGEATDSTDFGELLAIVRGTQPVACR